MPLLLLAPLLGVGPLPAGAGAAGLFVLSLALAITVGLAIEFIFGGADGAAAAAASGPSARCAARSRRCLSGALVPLALLPQSVGAVFGWLPFASMASAPLRIYTGTGEPLAAAGAPGRLVDCAVAAGALAVARKPRKDGVVWRVT